LSNTIVNIGTVKCPNEHLGCRGVLLPISKVHFKESAGFVSVQVTSSSEIFALWKCSRCGHKVQDESDRFWKHPCECNYCVGE